ncbi:PREDICTED: uncharacterized protein LOC109465037 [Branchiostoma belcheri]|uniref:Uncharacterized protein LOC109465037 n=1 Tax=Branchiostoma belcheri TaxID=7741 RepID=A0A6P4YG38_BRABE|nr:PREDICTED: uncharacterized protein LOC109465037 [Branchiostoma belcheri]
MLYYLLAAPVLLVAGYAVSQLLVRAPPRRAAVYSQPGPWYRLKYWAFVGILAFRKWRSKNTKAGEGMAAGMGVKSRNSSADMEEIQKLQDHPKAIDAVYFNGSNRDGVYFVAATARRPNKVTQTVLYLRFPDIGLLEHPCLPNTAMERETDREYAARGLRLEMVEPMKVWRLSYSGKMRAVDQTKQLLQTEFVLTWTACTPYYDFDTDMEPWAVADAMAREPWSREFFQNLQDMHQTHYEQFGTFEGTVHVEGYQDRKIVIKGLRDHSYGKYRDWSLFHRYGLQMLHLEDGTCFNVGIVSMPATMSRLALGYVLHPDGSKSSLSSLDWDLSTCGEDGIQPKMFAFDFMAGGKKYHLECKVLRAPIFYIGFGWTAKIHEGFAEFTVNGVPGWGIAEWDFRNHGGLPEEFRSGTTGVEAL